MNSGRPQCYTAAKAALIVEAIRRGMPLKLAAAAGGVSYNTFVRWRNDGSNPDGPPHLKAFLNQIRMVEAEAAQRIVGLIESAAEKSWQAAAWMLERRYPEIYGKNAEPPSRPLGDFEMEISDDD